VVPLEFGKSSISRIWEGNDGIYHGFSIQDSRDVSRIWEMLDIQLLRKIDGIV